MERERQERGLVGPVLEESAFPRRPPCRAVQKRSIVVPEPREGGQVVGAGQDVHAVDLVEPSRSTVRLRWRLSTRIGRGVPKPWAAKAMRLASDRLR